MRVLLLILSLLVSIGCVVLAYLELVGEFAEFYYVITSTAIAVFLAFVAGHFMYKTYRYYKDHKKIITEASDQEDLWHQAQNENAALHKRVNKLEADLKTAHDELSLNRNWDETIVLTATPQNEAHEGTEKNLNAPVENQQNTEVEKPLIAETKEQAEISTDPSDTDLEEVAPNVLIVQQKDD